MALVSAANLFKYSQAVAFRYPLKVPDAVQSLLLLRVVLVNVQLYPPTLTKLVQIFYLAYFLAMALASAVILLLSFLDAV